MEQSTELLYIVETFSLHNLDMDIGRVSSHKVVDDGRCSFGLGWCGAH